MNKMDECILIIDFGSQLTQLIARRVRESGVYCEIVPFQKSDSYFKKNPPKGVILSGGPASAIEKESPLIPQRILDARIPVLGICYGQMAMSVQLGGKAENSQKREFGRSNIVVIRNSRLFEGVWSINGSYPVWMSHGDRVTKLPDGFEVLAYSSSAPFAVFGDEKTSRYGLMFHPEVVHTPDGHKLIANFVRNICECSIKWTMNTFKNHAISNIRNQVGKKRVICGLSGGVDSSVAAILTHKAIGDNLTCILVDHGLMRKNEAQEVITMFRNHYNIKLVHIDASDRFISALKDKNDPEAKRKVIGRLFIEVFEEQARKIASDGNLAEFLVQGTLYPDVIESISFSGSPSVTIKSHHNVGGLPKRMQMKLVEPLRELFKDEVRNLGIELGLPKQFINRHPFPGPGLAIRCPGRVTEQKLQILRDADAIYLDEIRKAGLYDRIWQAFAVLLPVKTVGVMGDGRTYEYVCALRAVTSVDGMTADFFPYDMTFLGNTATRIINEVSGINRVVYDVTSKPPGTIEWE